MLKKINFDVELLSTAPKMQFSEQTVYTNDLNSAEIVFNILDSESVDLSDATASVLLFMKDGSFFQSNVDTGVTVDTDNISYMLKENEGNHNGLARVQLVVVAGNVEYATQQYRFRIESGLEMVVAQEVMIADWTTLTREARDYIDEMEANEAVRISNEQERMVGALTINDELTAQFQAVIDSTTGKDVISAPEIIVARDGEANLNARLDKDYNETTDNFTDVNAQLADIAKLNNQSDFVDIVKDIMTPYTAMLFEKTAANTYQVRLNNKEKGVVYQFIKDLNDDFIKIDTCGVGISDTITGVVNPASGGIANPIFDNGTFAGSGNHFHTTTVNDFVTFSGYGTTIKLFANTETRGGLWQYVIDGVITGTISCYNASTLTKLFTLATDLALGVEHTVVFTFMGDDPNNAPSSSPSRGYMSRTDDPDGGMITLRTIDASMDKVILASSSNKEFAFSCIKNGFNNWIPEHDGVGSTFAEFPTKITLDNKVYGLDDLVINEIHTIDYFELNQKMLGKVVSSVDVVRLNSRHLIGKDNGLSYNGNFKALTSFSITGYPMMLPSDETNLKDFFTGIYNEKQSTGDGSFYYFEEEKDNVLSGAVVSSTNPNLIGAITMANAIKSYRKGKTGKPTIGEDLFLWQRATKPKMYWQAFKDEPIILDDYFSWGFNLIVADIDSIYNVITQ